MRAPATTDETDPAGRAQKSIIFLAASFRCGRPATGLEPAPPRTWCVALSTGWCRAANAWHNVGIRYDGGCSYRLVTAHLLAMLRLSCDLCARGVTAGYHERGNTAPSPAGAVMTGTEYELSDTNVLFAPKRFNKRTWQRFRRNRRGELIRHAGGAPSTTQLILIDRIVHNEWDLRRLDLQLSEGELSQHAMRTRLAMENRLRLDLQALGFRAAAAKPPTPLEYAKRAAAS